MNKIFKSFFYLFFFFSSNVHRRDQTIYENCYLGLHDMIKIQRGHKYIFIYLKSCFCKFRFQDWTYSCGAGTAQSLGPYG